MLSVTAPVSQWLDSRSEEGVAAADCVAGVGVSRFSRTWCTVRT